MTINSKIVGTTHTLRGTFYTGGANLKSTLQTNLGSNADILLEAKNEGINGNDISLQYIDTGLESTDFKIEVNNSQDIVCTLERTHARAYYQTSNTDADSNVKFTAATAGTTGNSISVSIQPTTDTPVTISSCAISSKTVTMTTGSAHGFSAGDVVGISGFDLTMINGCFQIATVADATHFTYQLTETTEETESKGFGIASKTTITVDSSAISIASPQDSGGYPMLTPKGLSLAWGRSSAAKALASCKIIGDIGNKPIGYISTRYLTGGKPSAIATTALDIKREIENDATAKLIVDAYIPVGQTGMGAVSALEKTYLSGGSNLVKTDPDNLEVTVTIYDEFENVLETIEPEAVTRLSLGVYECNYTSDIDYRTITVEFKGLINELPVLSRQEIDLGWSNSDTSTTTT